MVIGNAATVPGLRLDAILAEPIGSQYKAFPLLTEPLPVGAAGEQGWNALRPPFSTPVMVLKDSALQHNIDLVAEYCARHGVSLAPHTKTPIAPQIAARQLEADAWALTVADVHQAVTLRRAGATRLFVANEVVDAAAVDWIARELTAHPELEFYCLVDSERGARLLDERLGQAGFRGRLSVLVEYGIPGARCGCRTVEVALAVARQVAQLPRLRLVGVEAYENLFPLGPAEQTMASVDAFLAEVRDLTAKLDTEGLFTDTDEIIVSAGGSMWFDRVVMTLGGSWGLSRPVRTVIRAGAYVTHDGALYDQYSPLGRRASGSATTLAQALELWAVVLSRPEPGLAILNFGKRDAAHDRGFPIPFAARTEQGAIGLPPEQYEVVALSDQHARLQLPADSELAVGDLVGCRISHPCTSFDNWRLVPLVDDKYDVVGAVRSYL